jgi:hypothetical protein
MGGQSSKVAMNAINERITEISTNLVANCQTISEQDQSQKMVISGIFSWGASATAVQNTEINSRCLQDDQMIQSLQNQVINAIGSNASADGISLLPAFGNTNSEQIINLNNSIRTSLSKNNIINNYNSIMQKQKQEIENRSLIQFGTTLTATQGAKAFSEAVLKSLTDSKVMSAIQQQVELQTSATSNNPLDIIGRAFSSVFGGIATVLSSTAGTIMFIVFALMIVIVIILVVLKSSGGARILSTAAGDALKARAGVVPKPGANNTGNKPGANNAGNNPVVASNMPPTTIKEQPVETTAEPKEQKETTEKQPEPKEQTQQSLVEQTKESLLEAAKKSLPPTTQQS